MRNFPLRKIRESPEGRTAKGKRGDAIRYGLGWNLEGQIPAHQGTQEFLWNGDFKKLGSILAGLAANSAKSCIQRYEIIKNSRLQVPEACRRYTMETFPGEDVKVRMVELWSDSGRTPNPGENVADAFVKLRANGLPGLRKLCDSGAR